MARLDVYIIRQMIGPFLFFVLVFTGVIWLSQSLRVIDTVVNNGQSGWVFLEFTALLLPRVMTIVLPVAAFAATLYAINRLDAESELVVIATAGVSRLRLLRPIAIAAFVLTVIVALVTLWLVPLTQGELRDRITQVRGDVAAAFIREGAFLTPARGVTVYIRQVGRPGELMGVFVHDKRDPAQVSTYTAERAVLLDDGPGTRLVMFDGVAQIAREGIEESLSVLRFTQLGYDLSQFAEAGTERDRKPSELYVGRLLTIGEDETGGRTLGEFRAEGHEALSSPLYVPAFMLLAVAIVVAAGFRRRGFSRRVVVAVAVALALRVIGLAIKSMVAAQAALWPLLYVPPLAAIALAIWLMARHSIRPPAPGSAIGGSGKLTGTQA
ncbi:LPS export ABC transporter permease LptF [Limibaculum sp. M0105]|uniref:LPS export ABC transporter permease LptF n=1 Tax=Thermohalobaculum xanthum TaxID=2753746 RepID=A0A8J7SCV2_9RHOB|nr:LPS export ABC transporter permease LptF [Thermohalobaculum xanthum]MBK0398848.1 LPS export ABC transporter permease LptF [Thermohalobaculum xanthum]